VLTAFCLVVAIVDGDTLKVRCDEAPVATVRLAEIDAPEKRQPFGEASRQHLADLCFQTSAKVTPQTKDRYGRTVARVSCAGQDANAEQVRAGMAWAFTKYLKDPAIKVLEREAYDQRRGLWADAAPVSPWDWREATRPAPPPALLPAPPSPD